MPDTPQQGRVMRFVGSVGPKLFITIVAAIFSLVLIPRFTQRWQDHKQQLELRTSIAGEMSRAYTNVIVTGRFVTGGLVYSGSTSSVANKAATQNTWTGALRTWLVASETIGAELTGRYGVAGLATDWSSYAAAVTGYMRLGSQVTADMRANLLKEEQAYVQDKDLDWRPLTRTSGFKKDEQFRASYEELGASLLKDGDALVLAELRLDPRV